MSVRTLKITISVIIALLIFVGAFYIAGGFSLLSADPNQDFTDTKIAKQMPVYKNRHFLPMGNKISANNLPMELGYFTSKDDIEELKSEFLQKFRDMGYNPQLYNISKDEAYIQAIDRTNGEQKIIILKKVYDETMVFAGITPTAIGNPVVKPDSNLGIPSDASDYLEIKNNDYGRSARTISFRLKGYKEKNLKIYIDRLKELNFEENEFFKNNQEGNVLVFSKENIQIMAVAFENEDENGEVTTSFVLNVMEKKDEKE